MMLSVSLVYAFERCMVLRDAQKSMARFTVQIIEGAKDTPPGEYSFCCLHSLVLFKTRMKDGRIGSILVCDYNNSNRGV
ncbi:MAG: hypothetical protein SWO11_17205 [Thermodesulfobacteriota bacterium]|nr:hypothetical protein [Thermodesulfobacteriota bacterium]